MMKKKIGLGCIILLVSQISYADEMTDRLTRLLSSIQTLQAHFIQKNMDAHKKKIQQASGIMALKRPGQFYWETQHPIPQKIITDGKKLWIVDPDLEQVTIRAVEKNNSETPALLLSDSATIIPKHFSIQSVHTQQPNWQWFLLKPKSKNSALTAIKLGFYQNQIREMQLQDHLDNMTRITFTHVTVNGKVATNLFHFHPTKNLDIIDETRKK